MRDPGRIDKILDDIKSIWKKHPDMRLGQLLCNVIPETYMYFVEDDSMIDAVKKYYGQIEGGTENGN